jgi:CMP-N,N'-diacetyllegionaminic acid synthase
MLWCIIPARRGSTGCVGKNIRTLPDGSSLIGRAVDVAHQLGGSTVLTTDFPVEMSRAAGYSAGRDRWILRPALLATDDAPMLAVLIHALAEVGAGPADTVCLLQPTSPFRTAATVKRAIKQQQYIDTDSACSAMYYPATWHPSYQLGQGKPLPTSRQTLPLAYRPDGGAYVSSMRQILTGSWGRMAWVESPASESLTIDTEQDWAEAVRRLTT